MDNPINIPDGDGIDDDKSVPRIGMKFGTEKEAYDFYNTYGGNIGFSVRREYANKSKIDKTTITSRRFVCNKQGSRKKDKRDINTINPRAETRVDCPARMSIKLTDNGKYECHDFISDHNHILHKLETTHYMRSQRMMSSLHAYDIDLADDSGIKPKATFELMGRQVGGSQNLGYTRQDQKNYLRTKRQRDLKYGEAGSLLLYFEKQIRENPSFVHAVQLDNEEQITNVFWADAKMIIDYALFGDVVTFDTTYCTNKENRPLGIFAGFNHHREVVIFGATLLYDETAESFKWLFETFLQSHGQKMPITIFTDQDAAMAKAIPQVMPNTWHGLCTFHIMQNGIRHLGNLMKDGSCLLKDFKTCMFHYEEPSDFEKAWEKFRSDYLVEKSSWLDGIYKLKEKWAKCYMKKTLTLGMRSTQLSESFNGDLKDYVKASLDVVQFFKHFERVVKDKRENELLAEFVSREKLPRNKYPKTPILKHAGEVYTPKIFDAFHHEYELVGSCYLKHIDESEGCYKYVVAILNEEGDFKVFCSPSELMIQCSCKKFETFGILCCHALKIFDRVDIKSIPHTYILRRWTREARDVVVEDSNGNQIQEDIHMDSSQRYRRICPKLVHMATLACDSSEGYTLLDKNINDMMMQFQNMRLGAQKLPISSDEHVIEKAKGLKKKEGCKGGKRKKSWVEKQGKGKKKSTTISNFKVAKEPTPPIQLNDYDRSQNMKSEDMESQYMEYNDNFTSLLTGSCKLSETYGTIGGSSQLVMSTPPFIMPSINDDFQK